MVSPPTTATHFSSRLYLNQMEKVRFSLKSRYRDYFSCKTKFHLESETESFSLNPLVFNTYYREVKSFANVRTELGHRY